MSLKHGNTLEKRTCVYIKEEEEEGRRDNYGKGRNSFQLQGALPGGCQVDKGHRGMLRRGAGRVCFRVRVQKRKRVVLKKRAGGKFFIPGQQNLAYANNDKGPDACYTSGEQDMGRL